MMILGMAEAVQDAINNGIDLLREGAGIDVMALTFITQILATIVLFLIVRFKFWNVVTKMIDTRKQKIQSSLMEKDQALNQVAELKMEAASIEQNAKISANQIIENAKLASIQEADAILNEAHEQIAVDVARAKAEIEQDRRIMEQGVRNEIIDVAYLMAEKITTEELTREKSNELVDDFFQKVGKK